MQSISFRIWTRVTVSISYDDNHYTTGTSLLLCNSNNLLSVICLHAFRWIYTNDLLVNCLLIISFINELELIWLHCSIAIVSTLLNGFNYYYLTVIIQFNIIHLLADSKWLQLLLFNPNHSIEHSSFICTESNGSKYFYIIPIFQFRHTVKEFQVHCNVSLTIQLNISYLFIQLNNQFYF